MHIPHRVLRHAACWVTERTRTVDAKGIERETSLCQNHFVSESFSVRTKRCQNCFVSETKGVRIVLCQNHFVSEQKGVRIVLCQNRFVSESFFCVRIVLCVKTDQNNSDTKSSPDLTPQYLYACMTVKLPNSS